MLSRRILHAAIIGCAGTVLLAACTAVPLSSPVASDVTAPAPVVGECHNLDRAEHFEILSDAAPAVECGADHTTETYLIGDLASVARFSSRYPALEERLDISEEICSGSVVRAYVGANARQALYGVSSVAFLPTPQQWADGERWVRCDLVVVAAETQAFEPLVLQSSLRNGAASGEADPLLRCYRDDASSDELPDVRCSEAHVSRDINMWIPLTAEPSELEIVQQCVPAASEWGTLTGRTVEGVSGVLHTESNGSLTLRCVVTEAVDVAQ